MGDDETDVWQGTLALKALEAMGAMHSRGIARRIEQTSGENATAVGARTG